MKHIKFIIALAILIGCGAVVMFGTLVVFGSFFFEAKPTLKEVAFHIALFIGGITSSYIGVRMFIWTVHQMADLIESDPANNL